MVDEASDIEGLMSAFDRVRVGLAALTDHDLADIGQVITVLEGRTSDPALAYVRRALARLIG